MPPLNPEEGWHPQTATVLTHHEGKMAWQWKYTGAYQNNLQPDSILFIWHSDYPGVTFSVKWNKLNSGQTLQEQLARWEIVEDRIRKRMSGTKTAIYAATTEKEGTEDAQED